MLRGPGGHPNRRVLDRVFVEQRVRVAKGESLDQRQVLTPAQERPPDLIVLPVEVHRLDHERLTVPVSAGITHPLSDTGVDVGPSIERDDPRVVVLLGEQHHVVRSLKQLDVVVVAAGADRGARLRVLDAPVAGVEVGP